MNMFSAQTYSDRRKNLISQVGEGLILLPGLEEPAMNYTANTYRFRQDSNFLYYGGIALPGLDLLIDTATGQTILFGNEFTIDDTIWIGPHPSLQELGAAVGITSIEPPDKLANYLSKVPNHHIHYLPPYRYYNITRLASWLGLSPSQIAKGTSEVLIKAVVNQRSYKTEEELLQMTDAVNITRQMHIAAMQFAKAGMMEYQLCGHILQAAHQAGAEHLSYQPIVSVRGEVLHNHGHDNTMQNGQLLLNDSGAENKMFYAGDITRTFPVSGRFTPKQRDIYDIVLEMEETCIDMLRPGLMYRDVHIAAYKIMLQRFSDLGFVQGHVDDMIDAGVAGMFMPHGLGHMIGLDVHDMEDLGEKYVGYRPGLDRSTQLGLKSLRLAKELEAGFVITVEPGIYFIPQLIEKWKAEGKCKDFINYDKLKSYYDFGGIRIEDNVLITNVGFQVLGDPIPKTATEVEEVTQYIL